MNLNIRKATMRDLEAIVLIDQQVSGIEKTTYWKETLELCRRQKGKAFFLVAQQDRTIVGFIVGEIRAWEFGSPACGWVHAIAVTQAQRLEGVGSALLDGLCEGFRQAGIPRVRTMVARQNHELLSFFRSQGMMAGPFLQLELDVEER